jgi:hypothetical protein
MRDEPVRRKMRRSAFLLSGTVSMVLVLLVVAANMLAIGVFPAFAPLTLLATSAVLVVVILRYDGDLRFIHKAAVLAACVVALYLMLAFAPEAMEEVVTSSRTEGLPAETGYFASATIATGVMCLAFLARETRVIPLPWKFVMVGALMGIDLYVWTSHDAIGFVAPLAYGAIWPLTLFTVTIPFTVFAYPKSYASHPMDAWR